MDKMPETCKICTQYLNERLPNESCYTYCPKYDKTPINVEGPDDLKKCPKCNELSLFLNIPERRFECLNVSCKTTYTEQALRRAYWHPDPLTYDISQYSGYMDDGGWAGGGHSPYDIEQGRLRRMKQQSQHSFWWKLKHLVFKRNRS